MAGRTRMRQYLSGERDVRLLGAAAVAGAATRERSWAVLRADLAATWRLIRAYARGDYRGVRTRSILALITAVAYFVWPIDLIPDVFLIVGFTDDVVVAALLFKVVRQELAGFRTWEQGPLRSAAAIG